MDGLIFGGHYMAALRTGRVPDMLQTFDALRPPGKASDVLKIAEIKISLSNDREAAREFVKENAGHRILNMYRRGYTNDDLQKMGLHVEDVHQLDQAEKAGVTKAAFDDLVTDDMIDAIFIAGEPEECVERMIEIQEIAEGQGFHQLMFSELGPDIGEGLSLLCEEIITVL